ncbi:hypothetical protein ACEZDB_32490 [Streptacidiphilus sp. N1-3]|uniref:Uncharacterized protein n=1 Tax=Streptacidiphilus alkalitolerans TaxID=3342712 RepID=A0ABV6XAR8_9ACTN
MTLPAPCQWCTTTEAAISLADGQRIPLLRPADPDRAERWARVLGAYEPQSRPRPPAPPGARIASIGSFQALGTLAAQTLGRPHSHHLDLHALTQSPGPGDGSLLVVAPAPALTLAALLPLLAACADQQTHVGLLTGRDEPGATFTLAKILAATRAKDRNGPAALIEGPTGRSHTLPDRSALPTRDALAGTWHSLILDGHGTAAHAHLGSTLLCGLTNAHEHDTAGQPIRGGCTAEHCKLDPSGRHPRRAPHEIATRTLALFVCNAIALGTTEQYPSDVNLALDALDGHPAAVLGLLRGDLETSTAEPTRTADLFLSGLALGQCTTLLNEEGNQRGITGASAVLLGDPEYRAHLPSTPRPAPGQPIAPATSVPAHDSTDETTLWTAALREADAFEHALRASLRTRPDRALGNCLDTMTKQRTQATEVLWQAVREPDHPDHPLVLQELADGWARAALTICSATASGAFSRQWDAARIHHQVDHHSDAGPCAYCGAPRTREHLRSPLLAPRTAIQCPRCGPAVNLPGHNHPIDIRAPHVLQPGQAATITITLPSSAAGLVHVHLRPRTTSNGPYDHTLFTASPGPHTITLAMPQYPTPELDRLWIIHAQRFRLAFYQERIPTISFGRNNERGPT